MEILNERRVMIEIDITRLFFAFTLRIKGCIIAFAPVEDVSGRKQ
jgi:hypothetical protein